MAASESGQDAGAAEGVDDDEVRRARCARWAEDVEPLLASADTGDVVLINRKCMDCSTWYGAFTCALTKEASTSKWSDVAMVVRDSHGEPQLLSARANRVALTPLRERVYWWKLSKPHAERGATVWNGGSDGTEVVLRSLEYPRTPELRAEFEAFARTMVGQKYEHSFLHLLSSIVNTETMQDRERLEVLRKTAQTHLAEIQRQLRNGFHRAGTGGLMRRSLKNEQHRLLTEIHELESSIAVRDRASKTWFSRASNQSHMHGPKMVATVLLEMGLLDKFPPVSSYNPKAFSTDAPSITGTAQSSLRLLQDARLGAQVHLTPYVGVDVMVPGSPQRARQPVAEHRSAGKQSVLFALQRHPVLSTLEHDDIIALSDAFEPCRFADGDTIFERPAHGDFADDSGEGAWVSVKGNVRSYTQRAHGAPLETSQHAAGELLGADDILNGRRFVELQRSATCHDHAGCEVWRCARGQLRTLAQQRLKPAVLQDVNSRIVIEKAIEDHFLFADLSPTATQAAVHSFARVTLKAGDVVYNEGDPANYMYVLESGELEAWKEVCHASATSLQGDEQTPAISAVKVDTIRDGEVFGDMGLVFESKRNATMIARTDCVLWSRGRQDLVRLGQSLPIRKLFDDNANARDRRGEPCMTHADFLRCISHDKHDRVIEVDDRTNRITTESSGLKGLSSIRQRNAEITGKMMLLLADSNQDGLIDFLEFLRFDMLLNKPNVEVEICFRLADTDRNGYVSRAEFEHIWQTLIDKQVASPPPKRVLKRFDEIGELGFDEFSRLWSSDDDGGRALAKRLRAATSNMVSGWRSAALHPTAHHAVKQQSDSELVHLDPETPWHWRMLGLCVSSAVAHTVVAPLDRLKVMQQALGPSSLHDTRWMGYRGLFSIWETEGLRGLWRGHTASLLRIVPLIALNSYLFGLLRPLAVRYEQGSTSYPKPLSSLSTLIVSGSAGMAAQAVVHPLDLLRAKMCVQTRGDVVEPRFCPNTPGQWAGLTDFVRGMWQRRHERNRYNPNMYSTRTLVEAYREQVRIGGVRGLWRGAAPAVIGAGLWTGVSFTIHDTLLPLLPREADGSGQPKTVYAMTAALWASRIAQVVAYPFDTLKRSMQCAPADCTTSLRVEYRALVGQAGYRGLFRGFPVMLAKIGPSVAVSYFTYHRVLSLRTATEKYEA